MGTGNRKEQSRRRRARPSGRANELWNGAKRRAARKHLEFTLTRDRVSKAVELGRCEATGIGFDFTTGVGRLPFSPSIDRKDNSKGYTDNNVQIVVNIHNQARGCWGDAAVIQYVKAILKKARKK